MKKLIAIMAITCLTVATSIAQVVVSKVQDKSVAFRVYNGYTGTLTYAVGADTTIQTNIITCDGHANTLRANDALTNGTIALLSANVAACTNASGTASLIVDDDSALTTDSTIGTLLPGTYTATSGKWLEVLWDTSVALHYDIYLPGGTYGKGAYKLSKVTAYPGGTGNVTMGIYQSGTLIAQKVITSPVYVNPATLLVGGSTVTTNTLGIDATVNIDWPLDIRSLGAQPIVIRATRATTASSGVISAIIE